ncbi:septal ring lytic transglycosylase RlpA family protein [Pseudothauera rhizosphaerae]|uniref:Endolytic peptidoglycan transglycosylase RlpA n=1 Tax=Pseudothauera rhizosphaerae TaxID=2565932 RepID=A0A4S4ASF6_9RHOO|nr:septal ring lytic transglycosylase RlpA family protein [Pseudothauera rhizosphaerae]THF62108.1 septal ring lytic transglycosylase RlpA family protein [Pseudothauera rhizosphaerae]
MNTRLAPTVQSRAGLLAAAVLCLVLAACGSTPRVGDSAGAGPQGGGYYKNDGPGANPPPDLDRVADAVPRAEPLHRYANRPYSALGQNFVPATAVKPFRQRGTASWYGRRFHGQPTSSGEPYDMYAMTAAHTTLPIPSYARVTSLANGRSVVVRINDRGPFLRGRIIDLSYAAANRLGYVNAGHAEVEVEALVPGAAGFDAVQTAAAQPSVNAVPGEGVYLQLGVFAERSNAEDLKTRVQRELAGLSDRLLLVADGARFRLHLGPWSSEGEARGVAEQVARVLGLQPYLLVR